MPRESTFGIYQEAPYQGITNKSWTKLNSYRADYVQIVQNCEPGKPCYTAELPIDELMAYRTKWYDIKEFVKRNKDLNAHYFYVREIVAKLHKTENGLGYLEFYVPDQQHPAELAGRMVEAHGGIRTAPPVAGNQPVKPVEDHRLPHDFTSHQEMKDFFEAPPEIEGGVEILDYGKFCNQDDIMEAYRMQGELVQFMSGDRTKHKAMYGQMSQGRYDELMALDTSEYATYVDKQAKAWGAHQAGLEKKYSAENQAIRASAEEKLAATVKELKDSGAV